MWREQQRVWHYNESGSIHYFACSIYGHYRRGCIHADGEWNQFHLDLNGALVTVVNVPKIDTGTDANVTLRGVGLRFRDVRPELAVVAGRPFRPAVRELIAGIGAARQFRGLTPAASCICAMPIGP